eukprot:TRINITY_DN420_c0_g1_i16.p1 TRINITY_DN420_c0_g1~~TRINITY_DN420_c0_g1_i16.p1  ORF type:complete len:144 (+),score=35.37 TRINITY_DN420_c0_g1_i16:105-536(+)
MSKWNWKKLIGPAASIVFFIMAIVIVDVEWYQYKNGGNKVKLFLCKFKTDRGTNVNDFLDNGGGLCTWTHFCTIMNCILLALITVCIHVNMGTCIRSLSLCLSLFLSGLFMLYYHSASHNTRRALSLSPSLSLAYSTPSSRAQ